MWDKKAVVEHRHRQTLGGFLRVHWRYGQGAYHYHTRRSSRASGTIRDDLGFHCRLPSLISRRLSVRRPVRSVTVFFLLVVWQACNTLGFASAWLGK